MTAERETMQAAGAEEESSEHDECRTCEGGGKIACPDCDDEAEALCPACGGFRTIACPDC
jgi:hypothetical protein